MMTLEALALAALLAPAAQDVDARRSVAADARVSIESPAGSLRIVGWDKAEVAVHGTTCERSEGVTVRGSDRVVHIEVETDGNPNRCNSDLEVSVPKGASVEVETFSAGVSASGLTGSLTAESVHGGLRVDGQLQTVELDTVGGNVEVTGSSADVRAESVNGSVVVRGAHGEVDASSVSGMVSLSGTRLKRAKIGSVSGSLRFDGSLDAHGELNAETVSGAVDVTLPSSTSASFDVTTFSGAILNELSSDRPTKGRDDDDDDGEEHDHDDDVDLGSDLRFSLGDGSARVTIETLSGRIRLQNAGAARRQDD